MAGWWEGRGSAVGKSAKSLAKPQLFVLHRPKINQLPKTTFHTYKVVTILDYSLRKAMLRSISSKVHPFRILHI